MAEGSLYSAHLGFLSGTHVRSTFSEACVLHSQKIIAISILRLFTDRTYSKEHLATVYFSAWICKS